jgi:putative SOS response-associated peptidase YedK
MCNLYSSLKGPDAIRQVVPFLKRGLAVDRPLFTSIFPNQMGPVVTRDASGVRGLELMRWGFPQPPRITGGRPVTTVRNTAGAYWRASFKTGSRCLVPVTAFCEYQDGRKVPTWFARRAIEGDTRPLFFFAGITRTWAGTRDTKDEPVEGTHRLYSFLTTEPNAIVKPVHSKDMPVILTEPAELELWLEGAPEEALKLQRPAEEGILTIISTRPRDDKG